MLNVSPTAADVVIAEPADQNGATIRLTLGGVVDERRARTVHRSVIDALRRHRPARIDIDLCDCTLIDAAAVRGLLLCHADAAQLGCDLVPIQASVPIERIMLAAGLL
jgi:anti-anti-sigma regulatory factor